MVDIFSSREGVELGGNQGIRYGGSASVDHNPCSNGEPASLMFAIASNDGSTHLRNLSENRVFVRSRVFSFNGQFPSGAILTETKIDSPDSVLGRTPS